MKRTIYIAFTAVILATGSAYGQANEEINRQVNVTKDYAPRVARAEKLSIGPQMSDTVSLRPDFEYTVRPRAWVSSFGVAPIRAAQLNKGTYNPQNPLYLKVGGGYPGQSIFDLYATSTRPGDSGFGLYLNHYGQYADIEDGWGLKSDAKSTNNSAGLFGKAAFGRMSVSGEVGFDYDIYTNYTYINPVLHSKRKDMQHYSIPRIGILFGHDFKELSYFNFRVGVDGYLFQDRYNHKEHGINAFFELGKQFDLHNITLKAKAETWSAAGENNGSNTIVGITPRYEFSNDNFFFSLGAGFAYEMPKGENSPESGMWDAIRSENYILNNAWLSDGDLDQKFWFLPEVQVRFRLAGGAFNPYATLQSELIDNNYRSMTGLNPYINHSVDLQYAPGATAVYKLRAGFSGGIGSVFSYNIFAGGDIRRNVSLESGLMTVLVDPVPGIAHILVPNDMVLDFIKKLNIVTFGAEMEFKAGSGFTASLAGQYFNYKSDGFERIDDIMPKYTASLHLKYAHKDKWSVCAGAILRGRYTFFSDIYPYQGYKKETSSQYSNIKSLETVAPTAVDISLTADYNISAKFGIFVEGHNLANQKLYPYQFYRGVGINVSAGVKLKF